MDILVWFVAVLHWLLTFVMCAALSFAVVTIYWWVLEEIL